ncbi:MAG: glucoamylase family protein, partial [Pseudomonadota bacterium]
WGLSASDSPAGYAVHEPANDLGVISPTAALSAFPFTPQESMDALRHFYVDRRQELWGEFGFADAFSPSTGWVADGNLAIDQGPIVVMIENFRSGLLWRLFMSCPEVQRGIEVLRLSRTAQHS